MSDKFVDKYSPKTISDMVLSEDLKKFFQDMISSKKFMNCSLIASPGIGKTTLAKVLAKEANAEVLFMTCASGDGKVEAIQTKLLPFVQSLPMDDRPMFVILDELDSASATQDSSFQKSLRNVIESFPNVVYIATANYGNKIIPAILSRCPQINLNFTMKNVLGRVKFILDNEKISYTKSDLESFIKIILKRHYPDIRTILNLLQGCCTSGKFELTNNSIPDTTISENVVKFVDFILDNSDDLRKIRKQYLQEKQFITNYEEFAGNIFNYVLTLDNIPLEKDVVIKMADVIYQMGFVPDKEIAFFQFITVVSKLNKQQKLNG